ncbi:hypothetical protein [Brevibacillus sp. Leaf182]|uniref:hypothetical protein n=1 Tax=Brevibacillus sp. Leaf182 TaxID=1736290 RepID=UPI0006F2AFB7|nr:hypothetical protein [Brevibacillus sp. Leaf182]RAT96299.1 hypothetical protein ASG16_018075 [Brevibacillus sp. Leaf182]
MEHKAFLFDTSGFDRELRKIIITSGENNDPNSLIEYIMNNKGKIRSVYTGELLEIDWQNELELGNVQELADFALTRFYSPEDDSGLSYSWDGVLEALKMLPTRFNPEYCVLGRSIESEKFRLDPGGMGMGIVQSEDVPLILKDLIDLKSTFIQNGLPPIEDSLYEYNLQELNEAYNQLILLYREARDNNKGLLMTF